MTYDKINKLFLKDTKQQTTSKKVKKVLDKQHAA